MQVDVREGRLAGLAALVRSRRPAILHGATGFKGGYVDLIAAGVLVRRGYPVLVAEATWELGSRALDLDRLARIPAPIGYDGAPQRGRALSLDAVRRFDTACVHYAVLSQDELKTFPSVWKVDPARVHFTPFCATAASLEYELAGEGVLATGNSLRDYRALIQAAPNIPARLTLATSLPLPGINAGNVTVDFMTPAQHEARAREAAVVVVPLLTGTSRSAGQQTYLNAMAAASRW